MNFNYDRKQEYAKWLRKKEKEEEILRGKGVSEEDIQTLRNMDKILFNQERNYFRHQEVVKDDYFESIPDKKNKEVYTLSEILDEIEDEVLFEIIKNSDETTQKIIEYKYQGYTATDIAEMLEISIFTIGRKIKKIKKTFKKAQK